MVTMIKLRSVFIDQSFNIVFVFLKDGGENLEREPQTPSEINENILR